MTFNVTFEITYTIHDVDSEIEAKAEAIRNLQERLAGRAGSSPYPSALRVSKVFEITTDRLEGGR